MTKLEARDYLKSLSARTILRELIIESTYEVEAAKLTADVMRDLLVISDTESVQNLCLAQQRLGARQAELDALRDAAKDSD
jgi:hypothetical protein